MFEKLFGLTVNVRKSAHLCSESQTAKNRVSGSSFQPTCIRSSIYSGELRLSRDRVILSNVSWGQPRLRRLVNRYLNPSAPDSNPALTVSCGANVKIGGVAPSLNGT